MAFSSASSGACMLWSVFMFACCADVQMDSSTLGQAQWLLVWEPCAHYAPSFHWLKPLSHLFVLAGHKPGASPGWVQLEVPGFSAARLAARAIRI